MGRGTGTHDASAVALRPGLGAEEIRASLRGRSRQPKPRQAYRHLTLTVLPERDDDAYQPSTKMDALGLRVAYEPAGEAWHGGQNWICDTRVAYRKVIPGHVRRTDGFISRTEHDERYDELVQGSVRAVEEHLARPVTFGAPEEWNLSFSQGRWLRPIQEADGERTRELAQAGADELAHLAAVMPDGQWHLTSSYGPQRLILVREGAPIAVLACRRETATDQRLR